MMHAESNRERIILMICGELDDAALRELEAHLAECSACSAVLEEERAMADLARGDPDEAPSATLLQRCREDLHRALRTETAAGPNDGLGGRLRAWRLRVSPAWALVLVVGGFVAGRVLPGAGLPSLSPRQDTAPEGAATIANVDFGESDPLSDQVSLTYDTLQRTSVSGTAGEPRIRRVLVDTLRDSRNAGLRLMALDVLRGHVDDHEVRAALMKTVREDENAGARLKALEALRGRAADDPEVRGVIVQALLKDSNPGVRVQAIDALRESRGPETLAVLKRLADKDPNDYVRLRSAALVGEMQPQGAVR
jgi:hypothetical protein